MAFAACPVLAQTAGCGNRRGGVGRTGRGHRGGRAACGSAGGLHPSPTPAGVGDGGGCAIEGSPGATCANLQGARSPGGPRPAAPRSPGAIACTPSLPGARATTESARTRLASATARLVARSPAWIAVCSVRSLEASGVAPVRAVARRGISISSGRPRAIGIAGVTRERSRGVRPGRVHTAPQGGLDDQGLERGTKSRGRRLRAIDMRAAQHRAPLRLAALAGGVGPLRHPPISAPTRSGASAGARCSAPSIPSDRAPGISAAGPATSAGGVAAPGPPATQSLGTLTPRARPNRLSPRRNLRLPPSVGGAEPRRQTRRPPASDGEERHEEHHHAQPGASHARGHRRRGARRAARRGRPGGQHDLEDPDLPVPGAPACRSSATGAPRSRRRRAGSWRSSPSAPTTWWATSSSTTP